MKTVRVTDYTNQTPSKHFMEKMYNQDPQKSQNRWCNNY